MTAQDLFNNIRKKKSFLCIGLDTDIKKIPKHLLKEEDPLFSFNKQVIDATKDLCVAYKPNTAFYECLGSKGWESLEKTIKYIPNDIFSIADAKRGDIGNTSGLYARAFFEQMSFDAVTVAPYMGEDSVSPFLEYESKWAILLALTSNSGASDFQLESIVNQDSKESNEKLFERVLEISKNWGTVDNMMYVVGATRPEMFKEIRKIVPDHFLLVPGVGAQGGDLYHVAKYGMNQQCGLLVNASRSIIYADNSEYFAEKARTEALNMQQEMERLLNEVF